MMCKFGSSNHILSLLYFLMHYGNLIQYSECISLVPRTYNPIKNGPWELVCDAEKGFVNPVTITLPSGMTGVSCTPASPPFGYSCTFAAGYHGDMYESSNTVVINTTSLQDVNGTWSCGHDSETATYDLNPIINIPELKFGISPESFPNNVSRSTPSFGLSVTYGCISVPVTFEWSAVSVENNAEVNLQISSTISVNSTLCSVQDVYGYTTAIDTSDIFNVASGLSGFYSLKLEVHYTSGITALNSKEYPFLFIFSSGGGGSVDWGSIVGIIVAVIVIIASITIIICCLCNKRCRSRCLLKNPKCLFTCPGKDIVVIDIHDDKDVTIVRPTGEKIEIQCLRTEIGWYMFDDKVLRDGNGVRVKNKPCLLFNPFFEIRCLEIKHEGLYTYKRENDSKNGCMLTMEICKDIIISSKPCVYWAHEGEWLKLQPVETSVVVERWIKKNSKNEKQIIIPNPQEKSSLVLQNINNEDAGSYIAANTSETWQSGCLTLKIVNSLVTVGKKDDSHVTIIKNSIKLKFIGCKLANIKLLKWKKSLLIEGTKDRELESTSNYELILSKMTKNDEGSYWCEVMNKDGTSTNSGIITLHVVHDIVNVGLSPVSCSATIGDSIQIRYMNEIVPQQIIFTAKRRGSNQIAPEQKVTKITDTASLFIEDISKEDEGCYLFASADGGAISGVLTLSVMKGNESKPVVYLGQSENGISAFQPRNGANPVLDAIPKKENPDKKKKKKGKKKDKKKGVSEPTREEKEEEEETTNEEKDTT